MKTFFTLFTSFLISTAIFAADARPKSMLTIKSVTNDEIQVVVDGRTFEPQGNSILIQNIDAGYHTVKIYREKNYGFFNNHRRKFELVYNSSLAVKPRTSLEISVDRFGRTSISEEKIKRNRDWDDNDGYYYDREDRHDNDGRWEDEREYTSYARPMSDREFDQVMNSMQKEWFEANKLKSATQIINTNFFTADQVKEMMLLFTFENNKLEIAKQAYAKTIDKQNYYCVSDGLSFRSSKDELARFIRNCE